MNLMGFLRSIPQPVRGLYYFLVAACLWSFVVALAGLPTLVGAGVLSLAAVMLGGALVTNFRDSADNLARATAGYKPRGVDYSNSVMASPTYSRFFGGCLLLLGMVWLLMSL